MFGEMVMGKSEGTAMLLMMMIKRINGWSKVEDFPQEWGNLIRQSPLGQVLLNEKSP